MPYLRRRELMTAGLAFGAAAALPLPGFAGRTPPMLPADDWYIPENELPVLTLDPIASAAKGRIMAHGPQPASLKWGAVILVPGSIDIAAAWWGLRVGRRTNLQDGARLILRGGDPARPARLRAPGNEGVLELQNRSTRRVLMQVENLAIAAGTGGDAIRIDRASAVRLQGLRITGGKNGIFATHHPTDIAMDRCEVNNGGRGDGYSHNLYVGYVRSLTMRDCLLHAPAAPGHCFKCYAQFLDARGNTFAHYIDPADLYAGNYGGLPLIDRGAWGHSVMIGNHFVRRGPARPTVVDLRNRAFPPGFRPHVLPGWGTRIVPFEQVDNRDDGNPHLFRHLFYRNRLSNGLLPNGEPDPHTLREPGIFLRNNGSAPWNAKAGGLAAEGGMPEGWRPKHERTVAYLCRNRIDGTPPGVVAQRWAYRQREIVTPVQEWAQLPPWAKEWAGL